MGNHINLKNLTMRTVLLISAILLISLCSITQAKGGSKANKKHLMCNRLTTIANLTKEMKNIERYSAPIKAGCMSKFGKSFEILCLWAADSAKGVVDLYKNRNTNWTADAKKRACEKTMSGRVELWFWKNFRKTCRHMNGALMKLDKQSIAAGVKPVIPGVFKKRMPNGKFINLIVVC